MLFYYFWKSKLCLVRMIILSFTNKMKKQNYINIDNDKVIFKISKSKTLLNVLIYTLLLAIHIYFLKKAYLMPLEFKRIFLLIILSFLCCLLIWVIISGIKKLNDPDEGIFTNSEGIKINTGPDRGYFIKWTDISEYKVRKQRKAGCFLLIYVKNPHNIFYEEKGIKHI